MKNLFPLLVCFAVFVACNNQNSTNKANEISSTENIEIVPNEQTPSVVDDTVSSDALEARPSESLNDIRFAGWGKEQWIDNEYIRTLRKYIDAYNNGEITDTDLDEYKDCIKGKFILGDIQPYMSGGVIIYIIFCDHPEKMFYSKVYSSVNVQTREVYGYECRGLRLETDESGCTKEDIIQFLKDCPEYKMW